MNKLYVCIALGMVILGNHAYANPKITGTVKAIAQQDIQHTVDKNASTGTITKDEKTDRPEFKGSSRIKLSGSNKINDTLTAAYSLEYDFNLDSDRSRNLRSRSTYISLEHKAYGRIRAGRMTSPEDDLDISVTVGDNWGAYVPFSLLGGRSNNAIQYYSPYFGQDKKTRVKLHYAFDENLSSDAEIYTFINGTLSPKKRDSAVAQILHNGKTLGWGLSYTHAGQDFKALTGMVRYQATPKLNLALMARQANFNSGNNEIGAYVSTSYTLDNQWRVYGQAGYSDNYQGRKDQTVAIGAVGTSKDFKIGGNRATIFGEFAGEYLESPSRKRDTYGLGTGIVYKF